MAKTVIITNDGTTKDITFNINGVHRSLSKPTNMIVRTAPDGDGIIAKKSDESWRLHVGLADTLTINTVTNSPYSDLNAMVDDMTKAFQ